MYHFDTYDSPDDEAQSHKMATVSGGVIERENTIAENKRVLSELNEKYEFVGPTQEKQNVLFAKLNSANAKDLTKHMKSCASAWEQKNVTDLRYGSISEIPPGSWWGIRMDCARDRMHDSFSCNVQPGPVGAISICTAQSEEDVDFGESFTFTGHQYVNKDRDMVRDRNTESLILSFENQIPVRVIRGYNLSNEYSPKTGYRYDGLYMILDYWIAISSKNVKLYKFAFKRLSDQEPPPWKTAATNDFSHRQHTIISRCISNKKFQKVIDTDTKVDSSRNLVCSQRISLETGSPTVDPKSLQLSADVIRSTLKKDTNFGNLTTVKMAKCAKLQNTNISIRTDLYDSSHNLKHHTKSRDGVVHRNLKSSTSTPRRQLHLSSVDSSPGSTRSMPSVIMERTISLENVNRRNLSDVYSESSPHEPIKQSSSGVLSNSDKPSLVQSEVCESRDQIRKFEVVKSNQMTDDDDVHETRSADILDALFLHRVEHSYAIKTWPDSKNNKISRDGKIIRNKICERQRCTVIDEKSGNFLRNQNIFANNVEKCDKRTNTPNIIKTIEEIGKPSSYTSMHELELSPVARNRVDKQKNSTISKKFRNRRIMNLQQTNSTNPPKETVEVLETGCTTMPTSSKPIKNPPEHSDNASTSPKIVQKLLNLSSTESLDNTGSDVDSTTTHCRLEAPNTVVNSWSESSIDAMTIDKVLDIITKQQCSSVAKMLIKNVIGLSPEQLSKNDSSTTRRGTGETTDADKAGSNNVLGSENCGTVVKNNENESRSSFSNIHGSISGDRIDDGKLNDASEQNSVRTRSQSRQLTKNETSCPKNNISAQNMTSPISGPESSQPDAKMARRSRSTDVPVKRVDKYSPKSERESSANRDVGKLTNLVQSRDHANSRVLLSNDMQRTTRSSKSNVFPSNGKLREKKTFKTRLQQSYAGKNRNDIRNDARSNRTEDTKTVREKIDGNSNFGIQNANAPLNDANQENMKCMQLENTIPSSKKLHSQRTTNNHHGADDQNDVDDRLISNEDSRVSRDESEIPDFYNIYGDGVYQLKSHEKMSEMYADILGVTWDTQQNNNSTAELATMRPVVEEISKETLPIPNCSPESTTRELHRKVEAVPSKNSSRTIKRVKIGTKRKIEIANLVIDMNMSPKSRVSRSSRLRNNRRRTCTIPVDRSRKLSNENSKIPYKKLKRSTVENPRRSSTAPRHRGPDLRKRSSNHGTGLAETSISDKRRGTKMKKPAESRRKLIPSGKIPKKSREQSVLGMGKKSEVARQSKRKNLELRKPSLPHVHKVEQTDKRRYLNKQKLVKRDVDFGLKIDYVYKGMRTKKQKMVDVSTQWSPVADLSRPVIEDRDNSGRDSTARVPLPDSDGSSECVCSSYPDKSTWDPLKTEIIDLVEIKSERMEEDNDEDTCDRGQVATNCPGNNNCTSNDSRPEVFSLSDNANQCTKTRYSIESIDHSCKQKGFVRYVGQRPMAFVPVNSSTGNLTLSRLKLIGFKPIKPVNLRPETGDDNSEYGRRSTSDSPRIAYSSAVVKRSVHAEYDKYTSEENNIVRYMDNELCYEDIENEDKTLSTCSETESNTIVVEKMEFTKLESEDLSESSELFNINEDSKRWMSEDNSTILGVERENSETNTRCSESSSIDDDNVEPWHGWRKIANDEQRYWSD